MFCLALCKRSTERNRGCESPKQGTPKSAKHEVQNRSQVQLPKMTPLNEQKAHKALVCRARVAAAAAAAHKYQEEVAQASRVKAGISSGQVPFSTSLSGDTASFFHCRKVFAVVPAGYHPHCHCIQDKLDLQMQWDLDSDQD